jgi:hypothetical protein
MTNNKQQLSVEWLEIELEKLWVKKYLSPITIKPLLDKAKEMEKEQHATTWDTAMDKLNARGGNMVRAWVDFDDYYEQTFGGNNE